MVRRITKRKRRRTVTRGEVKSDLDYDDWLRGVRRSGMFPLDAPGIPVPGPNFLRHAHDLGDTESELTKVQVPDETKKSKKRTETRLATVGDELNRLYLRALREPGFTLPIEMRGGSMQPVTFIPGHIWGQHYQSYVESESDPMADAKPVDGPHAADVFILGKMPWTEEETAMRNLVGASGQVLVERLNMLRVKGTPRWYVSNLLKFVPPDGTTTLKAGWIKDCLPLLHQELRIVQPKYILCLGADASKALLGPKNNVTFMEGRVVEFTYSIGLPHEPRQHTALVMTVVHPAQVARDESLKRTLDRGLARFNLLQQGIRFDQEETGLDHRTIDTIEELESLCYEVEHDPRKKDKMIAVDAEWHGEHPVNDGSYMRTIQFAWMPKHGCGIKLRAPGGKKCFRNAEGKLAHKRCIHLLSKFFKGGTYTTTDGRKLRFTQKRVCGHFFNSDLEWLLAEGLDLRDEFEVDLYDAEFDDIQNPELRTRYEELGYGPGDSIPAWLRTRYEGGADTGLMAHAIEESAIYRLESLAMRYTTVPRYDVPLHEWREEFCKEHNLKAKDLEGYGECPDDVLLPYGIYDADATLRLFYEFNRMLDDDYEHNCCREPFWESMIAAPAVLEVHRNGICVDRGRIDYLTERFMEARAKQEDKIKRWARWPDFNVRSVQHVKEFLFGTKLNGKVTKDGSIVRIRPPQGRSLELKPLIDTGKPPSLWSEVVEKGLTKTRNPSTNKTVLSILAQDNDDVSTQINWIRDYRFLDQVLKTLLRPPSTDDDGNWLYEPDAGSGGVEHLIYDAGLAHVTCDDGRVRTHLYQTKETGRWASARPNLQNISKQRDPDYLRLLGEEGYRHSLRSILKASPGHVLIESDYVGAELFGMAIMSGDVTMIDHATRNQLPESDPNFYDIHSNVACMAFKLNCKPTKSGLKAIGKSHLRIIAKSVIFGIAYGRGAKAIAFAAKEQGIRISVDDAQRVIDTIFDMYPGLVPFFDECKSRALDERWLCHCFGRFRRFPYASDFKMEGEFERQAMNFPIQGMIASAMSRAIAYLYDAKREDPSLFRILLQIHDAILVEAPYENVEYVTQKLIPWAMRDMVPIFPSNLAGEPTGAGPYRLGVEADVMRHWGEKLTYEDANRHGMPTGTYAHDGMVVNYSKAAAKLAV